MRSNFPLVLIGDLVQQVAKWDPRKAQENKPFTYIDISSVNRKTKAVEEVSRVFAREAPSRAKQLVRTGDVLVSLVRPNLNVVACLDSSLNGATASTGFTVLRCKDDKLLSRYLFHWVRTSYFIEEMVKLATGASYPAVSESIVKESKLPLPLLEEQRRIAAVLDKADEIRRKRKEVIAMLDSFLQSSFLDMFGDPVMNPKDWKVKEIAEIANVATGTTPSRRNGNYYGGSIPWVKSTEVDWGTITSTEEMLTISGMRDSRCKIHPRKSILIAMYGQGKTRGKSAILGIDACTNQACAVIHPNEKYNTQFLTTLLKLSYTALRDLGRGGNQPNLNLSLVKTFKAIFPPKDLQHNFSGIADSILRVRQQAEIQSNHAENLFLSLRQRAFSGELSQRGGK